MIVGSSAQEYVTVRVMHPVKHGGQAWVFAKASKLLELKM